MPTIDRRRFLGIAAAFAGAALLARPAQATVVWRGQALGAPTELILNHPDPARARILLGQVVAELARLERIFTLYRDDSDLVALNRKGVLAAPAPEMAAALRLCAHAHAATGGRFDPTVQPVWRAHAEGRDPAPLRDRVGFGRVVVGADRIVLPRGTQLTLNGMAQGFITDRITDLLRAGGAEHTLVDMGEIRAIGGRTVLEPWTVALEGGGSVALRDRAIATTEPSGFRFPDGTPHLIDPATGAARAAWARLAVIAPEAGLADALSTGFALADAETITAALAGLPGVEVRALDARGRETRFG